MLFVCVHNSARSQMAETFLNKFGKDRFEAYSAGLKPGNLNPIVVEVMREIGIDISGNKTKSVFDFYKKGMLFNYVITVCDEADREACPIFPGITKNIHWGIADPSAIKGTQQEKIIRTREIRDEIKKKIQEFIASMEG